MDSSPTKSKAEDQSPGQPAKAGRPRLWFYGSLIVLTGILTAISIWHRVSPVPTGLFAAVLFQFDRSSSIELAVDEPRFTESVLADLQPLLASSPVKSQLEKSGLSAEIVTAILRLAMPVAINAVKNPPTPESTKRLNSVIAMLTSVPQILGSDALTWQTWISSLSDKPKISLGVCKTQDHRSACELLVPGPSGRQEQVALLWERQGLRWKLVGIAGLSEFFTQFTIDH